MQGYEANVNYIVYTRAHIAMITAVVPPAATAMIMLIAIMEGTA